MAAASLQLVGEAAHLVVAFTTTTLERNHGGRWIAGAGAGECVVGL